MSIVVYNTLTRKKEAFTPVTPGKVGIYLCGPTVYKPSHIGHAVGPIIFDAIKRYLVFRGYQVTWVVNITDVDDKLIIEAAKQSTTTFELATRITKDYLAAMKTLHVDGIDIMPKASEHIGDIIEIINKLIARDIAYASRGDVYFDVTKDADYGKLSNRTVEEQEGQRDLKSGEKRNAGDFALWKAAKPEEPDEVKFDSPWGKGRPGWHIECSAMASRFLGETFDIHGGGLDLIFPHHENEIAQSESANDKPFSRVWMHHGLTRVNTKKVSKSDASPEMQAALAKMTLHNLLASYPGELIRFFVLSTHYRRPIEYSETEIESKRKGLDTFYRLFERVERVCGQTAYENVPALALPAHQKGAAASPIPPYQGGTVGGPSNIRDTTLATAFAEQTDLFLAAMDDDFNTAGAIAALFEMAGAVNRFIEHNKLESEPRPSGSGLATGATGGSSTSASYAARARISSSTDATPLSPPLVRGDGKSDAPGTPADALAGTRHLVALARLIGFFLEPPAKKTGGEDGLADRAMQVLIAVRHHLRTKKDFETADLIRDLLTKHKITIEDRPDGATWRVG